MIAGKIQCCVVFGWHWPFNMRKIRHMLASARTIGVSFGQFGACSSSMARCVSIQEECRRENQQLFNLV